MNITTSLDIVKDDKWRGVPQLQARLRKVTAVTLKYLPKTLRFPFTANLLLTNNAAIRRLNWDFRGMDKPTNVLAFPQFTPLQLSKMGKKREAVAIGDIVIAYQYVVGEAKKDHKVLINHITHLLIHGLLHLFGYDHMSDTDAGKMERLEKRIMKDLGLPDPYKPVPAPRGKSPKPKPRRARQQRTKAPRKRL